MHTQRSRSNCALAVIVAVLSLMLALVTANQLYFDDIKYMSYMIRFDPMNIFMQFYNPVKLACFIVIFISALQNNRKTLFSTLVVCYGLELIYYIIMIVDGHMGALLELCCGIELLTITIMIMLLLFFALKTMSFKAAVIWCSILSLGFLFPFIAESYNYGLDINTLMSFSVPLIETAILILSLCMYAGAKFERLEGEKLPDLKTTNTMLWLFLTLITGGICGIVWLVNIIRNVHTLHNDERSVTGEVLLILFVPFYSFYWFFTRGKQIYRDSKACGGNMSDNSVSYLVFAMFGLTIVNYALIQSEFNNCRFTKLHDKSDNEVNALPSDHKTDMMFCRKCGKSILHDSTFCPYCGEKIVTVSCNDGR